MTSTELDLTTAGRDLVASPAPGTTAAALDMLRGHAEMMSAAHQLAGAMVKTAMVPAVYRGKADDAAAAILYGAEIGLNPIQSLQQVFPIHGQPAIYARTMVALLKARGFRFNTEQSTDTAVTVTGRSPAGETETSTWTIERAERAGYTSNKKYETDPQAMLYAKACAEVCRKLAPDVLLGISHTREDLELEPAPPVRVQSERVTADELLAEAPAGQPAAPKVQQWQPAADDVPAEGDAPADEPPVEAAGEPAPEPATREQLQRLSSLLEREGLNSAVRKRKYLSEQFGRQIGSARELTADEAVALTRYLENPEGERLDTVAEATVVGVAEADARAEGGDPTP